MKKQNNLLGIDLDALIQEAVEGLFESDDAYHEIPSDNVAHLLKRQETENAMKKIKSRGKEKGKVSDEAEESKPVKIKAEKLPEIDVEKIAEKINAVRAGKSLKEKETMSALKSYFQKLNGPERIALFAFLSGLETVLAGATDVRTPHSKPFNIEMEKEKRANKKPEGDKSSSKDDSNEQPIVVGESANKQHVLNVINSNRSTRK